MRKNSRGFTIVELLVVIAIIAVLAAIVLVNVTQYIAKSKRSAVEANLSTMLTNALSYYTSASGTYTGFAASSTYTNPKTAIENVTGSSTVVENESATAFCACAPLPDVVGSTGQTECVDSTGTKAMSGFTCANVCKASGSCNSLAIGIVGYWKLDESSGTTATDSSGNGNTGTYTGTSATTDVPSTITFTDPYSRSFNGTTDIASVSN